MRRIRNVILVMLVVFALACTKKDNGPDIEKGEGVMTFQEYKDAELDSEVVIEAYVQAKQKHNQDKTTVYLQDAEGGYYAYELACTNEQYETLVDGQKIKIIGYKTEWNNEMEIATGGEFELEDGNWIAEAIDVTALLGDDGLIDKQNMKVSFQGLTVEDSMDGNAYLYKWDGSGSEGDDIYFKVSLNEEIYTFKVESDLTGPETDVYKAVKELSVGDTINMEGFLYWYDGPHPHITKISK